MRHHNWEEDAEYHRIVNKPSEDQPPGIKKLIAIIDNLEERISELENKVIQLMPELN